MAAETEHQAGGGWKFFYVANEISRQYPVTRTHGEQVAGARFFPEASLPS